LIDRRTFLFTPLALAAPMSGQGGRSQPGRRKPNVVLIVGGSWRAQAVPWAGDMDVDAPSLAKLASGSVAFSRAYACYSRLDRAHACMLKGVFPHMLAGSDASVGAPLAEPQSIGTVLQSAGYRTGMFGTRQVVELVSFAHAAGDEPFFLEWTFDNQGSVLMERTNPASLHLRDNVPSSAEPKAREDMTVFYERARSHDPDIGIVLEALAGLKLVDDTIVVFTSYHGEQFGSHGVHGDDFVYEESMRIPLVIRYPRAIRNATSNDTLVSQVDLMPTLLKFCGVPIPETVQGRDLSGLLLGQSAARPDAIYAEGRLGQKDEWRMLVEGYDKLVTDLEGNVTHLYNLAEDPYEMTNLAGVTAQQLKRDSLLALERVWMKKLGDGVDASGLKKR